MSTVKTAFGRGIPLVNLDQVPSIPRCFVFQLGHKLRPAHVTDSLGKTMVFDHVLDLQALFADRLVFTNQTGRELMQEVMTSISNTGVYSSYFFTGLDTILAPFLFLSVSPLSLRQFLFILVEEFR